MKPLALVHRLWQRRGYGLGPQPPRLHSGLDLVLQQVRELERLDVVLDALDQVGLAVEQPVLLEEGAHERLRLVEVRAGVRLRVKRLGSGSGLGLGYGLGLGLWVGPTLSSLEVGIMGKRWCSVCSEM